MSKSVSTSVDASVLSPTTSAFASGTFSFSFIGHTSSYAIGRSQSHH